MLSDHRQGSSRDCGSRSQASTPAVTIHCVVHAIFSLDLSVHTGYQGNESAGHVGLCGVSEWNMKAYEQCLPCRKWVTS